MSASLPARARCFGTAMLYFALATPAARAWMEASMTGHMLLQIPLLAALGAVACRLLPQRVQDRLLTAAGGEIPCLLAAFFASGYWMLPRALDGALANPLNEALKFASLPLLVGAPLALAWKRLRLIGRGFVWTNIISMLVVLGWLYINAPVRVCNSYLADQQENAGWAMVKIAVLLFACWLGSLFIGGGATAGDHAAPAPDGVRARPNLDETRSSRWTTLHPQD